MRMPRFFQKFISHASKTGGGYPEPRVKDLILFVTDRCNLRCDHCIFWKRIDTPGPELTLEQVQRIASSVPPMRTVALTGGEPFLRGDLGTIVEIFFRDNQTQHVQVDTNGLLVEPMEALVQRDLAARYERHLTYQVSIDGLEETHDRLRNRSGCFKQTTSHLKRMLELTKAHPYFRVVVLTNINKNNETEIEPLANYLRDEIGVEHAYDLVRGTSFSAWNIPDDIRIDEDPRDCDLPPKDRLKAILEEVRRINSREGCPFDQCVRQLQIQVDLYHGKKPPFKCLTAGRTVGVVYSDGSVSACEFTTPFAHLSETGYDLGMLWNSEAANERRKRIQGCACTHSCFVLTSLQEWEEQQTL